jgi:uncharacterized protein
LATLTADMKRTVHEQRLGFFATVCEDGSPNVSPKGTTHVLGEDRLLFADIRSPRTVANIQRGSAVEVNVVDPFTRKGYRFKGPATVHEPGSQSYADGVELLRKAGSKLAHRVKSIVVIHVQEARPIVSPAYDEGSISEAEMIRTFQRRFAELHEKGDGGA